ncbi:hypothetical protein JCM10207_006721 [Rhodosporidiobolus poonsookiae]
MDPPDAQQELTMQEVIPGLWIGDYTASQDQQLLERNGIACVVSAMRQEYAAHPGMDLHRVAVDDTDKTNIIEHFHATADHIHAALTRNQGVLVHCQAGVSRSTTLVAAYLMLHHGLNVEQAVSQVRAVRSQVEPSDFFMFQLELFERCECEWDPVKWPEQRRFLMSFAQSQIMEGASPSIVLAYYPSPASTPSDRPGSAGFSMTPMTSQQISPPSTPPKSAAPPSASSPADAVPPINPNPLPGLSAPPMRKRLTPRKTDTGEEDEKEQKEAQPKPAMAKIGSKGEVVVTGRRIRCKMCRRELAAREHIVAHELGKGQQAFAPNRRDMVAFRAEVEKRRAEEAQKTAPASVPQAARPAAASAPAPPTDPLAALRISRPPPGLRVATPRGAPVARSQPVARPTPSSAPPPAQTTPSAPSDSSAPADASVEVVSAPDTSTDSSMPPPAPCAAAPSPSPPPPPAAEPPLLPSSRCSSYFVEPLSWMSPILETGVLAGKIVCPNKKCGAKLGNFDWAGNQCSCGAWVCPGFALNVSRVDEVTA